MKISAIYLILSLSFCSMYSASVKISNVSKEAIFVRINNNKRFWAPLEWEQRELTSLPFVPDIFGAFDNLIADFRPIRPGQTVNFNAGPRSIKKVTFMRVSPVIAPHVLSKDAAKSKVTYMLKEYAISPTLLSGKVPGKPFHSDYLQRGKFYQQKLLEKIEKYPKEDGLAKLYYPEKVETFTFSPHIAALKFGAHIEYRGWNNVERVS